MIRFLYVLHEITQEPRNILEYVARFRVPQVPVIAFASLVVVSDHPLAIDQKNQPVLDAMLGGLHRLGHLPDHRLDNAPLLGVLDLTEQAGLQGAWYAIHCRAWHALYPGRKVRWRPRRVTPMPRIWTQALAGPRWVPAMGVWMSMRGRRGRVLTGK